MQTNVWIALALTIGMIVLLAVFSNVLTFETNDDLGITALVKGLFGLSPGVDGIFISPLLGAVLYLLYKVAPMLPWYSMLLYVGTVTACFLSILTILEAVNNWRGRVAGVVGALLFIALIALRINFSAVSLLLWVTACAFLLNELRQGKSITFWWVLAALQLSFGYLLRPSLLLMQVGFAIPLLLTLLLRASRRVTMIMLVPVIIILIMGLFSNLLVRSGVEYKEYGRYNKARSDFTDTYRSDPNEKTGHALLAVGWSREDYLVAKNWWLHDVNIFNTNNYKKFIDYNSEKSSVINFDSGLSRIKKYKDYIIVITVWFCCCLPYFYKIDRLNLISLFLVLGIVFILIFIRFPERIAYPCFFMAFLYCVVLLSDTISSGSKIMQVRGWLAIGIVAYLAYIILPFIKNTYEYSAARYDLNRFINYTISKVILVNGVDTIFVDASPGDFPFGFSPFRENEEFVRALTLVGGWCVETPSYRDFLRKVGLHDYRETVPFMIDNRRVVLRFWSNWPSRFDDYINGVFLRHLRQRYDPIDQTRQVDVRVLLDFRHNAIGPVYFQLVTVPVVSHSASR